MMIFLFERMQLHDILEWRLDIVFMLVAFIELFLLIIQIYFTSLDKCISNIAGAHIKDITRADKNIGIFSYLNASCFILNPKHFCCV